MRRAVEYALMTIAVVRGVAWGVQTAFGWWVVSNVKRHRAR